MQNRAACAAPLHEVDFFNGLLEHCRSGESSDDLVGKLGMSRRIRAPGRFSDRGFFRCATSSPFDESQAGHPSSPTLQTTFSRSNSPARFTTNCGSSSSCRNYQLSTASENRKNNRRSFNNPVRCVVLSPPSVLRNATVSTVLLGVRIHCHFHHRIVVRIPGQKHLAIRCHGYPVTARHPVFNTRLPVKKHVHRSPSDRNY
jgi:hypothetical protein